MRIAGLIRGSLAAKLLLVFAAISVVLALLISGVEILQERDETIAARQREALATVMANIDTLSLALWAIDDRVLNVTANSLVRGASIVHVEVIEDGQARLKLDRSPEQVPTDYSWEVPLLRPGTAETIGTLRIWENYDDVRAQLARRGGILIVTELMKIFAASVLLFFAVYFMITGPLSRLAQRVETSGAKGEESTIALHRLLHKGRDEIDALVDAINTANAEQRRHRAREVNAGKMEALGRLAGGIAHDFNNILGAILGFAGLVKQDLPAGGEDRRFVERILAACARGKALIEQIRTFALGEVAERRVVDLARVMRQNAAFLSASLPKTTRLNFEPVVAGMTVIGSEALIGQAIANLCINASEALAGRSGEVTVGVGRAPADEIAKLGAGRPSSGERLVGNVDLARDYVCIRVADDAGGIANDVLEKIFEPFFTTKGRHRGTGLGLAVVRGVFESHGGACHVKSRLGEGTVFSLYLPRHGGPAEEGPAFLAGEEGLHGHQRILIVDDEPDLVDMLSIGLTRLGYETVGATDPLEALEAFQEDPKAWDVVVTDEVMPQMRGVELIRRLKAIRPDIKTVLCTGFSDTTNEEIVRASGIDVFLLKPVDAEGIAPRLRKLIDADAAR